MDSPTSGTASPTSGAASPTSRAASPTYQCVVCQSTCLTPNELHRHQSYRHTSEELSLSIMGVHNAAIRTFELGNGIAYDNSWLHDPRRHAEFYTYSANMLCDDNNNADVVDYALKNFQGLVVQKSDSADAPDDKDCTRDLDRRIDEKSENENFVEAQNFEEKCRVGESGILDLSLKIDLQVERETRMDTASDHFWDSAEARREDVESLGRKGKKCAASDRRAIETCAKSLDFEKLRTCVRDGLASKILDLGRKVFLEVQAESRTETAADKLGDRHEELCRDLRNLGRDVDEKLKNRQIETSVKVQNFDETQFHVEESGILDLSRKFYLEVQPETCMDTAAEIFGKWCEELCRDVGNLREETAKRRSSPSDGPAKNKARKQTTPRKKLDSLARGAAEAENTENRDSGNVDSVKQESQESQDSLSWFESEASKIKRFNDKVKQIRARQKKSLDVTKVARKQVKGEGSRKAKKRTMQSCGRGDAIRLSGNFDSEDFLGFDVKGATINASCSRNSKRPRVSRKKGKICETEADKFIEETAELPKKPINEETLGETGIIGIHANSSIFGSDQSLINFKSKKSQIRAPTAGKAKKPRVSRKKGKISTTETDNSAELPKRPPEEETAGETGITRYCAEHIATFDSDQPLFNLESSKSKIDATILGNVKKPRVSRKKRKINETETDNSAKETAELPKKPFDEGTLGETGFTGICAEHSSTFGSNQSLFNFKSKKSKVQAPTARNAKKPRVSRKKGKIAKTEADNSAELLRSPEEETAGETGITRHRAKDYPTSTMKGKIGKTEADNSAEETAELLKMLLEEETAGETLITQNQDNGNENCANLSSILSSDKYSSHFESKKSKVHATTSGNANTPRVADNSAEETAELLKMLLEEETAGETQIAQNQDTESGNHDEHSSIIASAESTFNCESKEAKIDAASSVNAKDPIASKRKSKDPETEVDEPAERENTEGPIEPGNQSCAEEVGPPPNRDFESEDSPICLDAERPKINAMCTGKAAEQAEKTEADKPANHESIVEIETSADQNCAKEAGLQPNWDVESADFLARLDAGRSKIKPLCAGTAGAQAEKTSTDTPVKQEITGATEKGANQNCANDAGPRPNGDLESADFFICSDGDGQNINATCAENAGSQAEEVAVEATSQLLRDRLTAPSDKETPRMTKKLQNEAYGNKDYAGFGSFFSSDEYVYYFPSEEAKMAALSTGNAKKPIASGKKSNNLKTITVWPAKQKMTRKIVDYGNDNLPKQSSASSRDVFSYKGSESEEATITPAIASGKKSNELKTLMVWPAKQRMTRNIVDYGNGNLSKQSSASSPDVFSYKGSESEEATITPAIASGKKSNNLKTVTVWPAKQKMTRKIVDYGNGNLTKESSASSRDVFSYTGSESEEATIIPISKFRAQRLNAFGKEPMKINAGDEKCAGHNSNVPTKIYTCTDRASKQVETSNAFGKKPKKINAGDESCAEHNSNFVPNIYTRTDRARKQVEIYVPSAGKSKKRQKSTNSETVSDTPVADETARGITKFFYQDFGSEMFASQTSPPIIDMDSSTESGNEEGLPKTLPAGNFGKSILARNKPKNLKNPEDEPALRETARTAKNSENLENNNVVSIYKDSSPIPDDSSACDNELPPVTFVAYPPYVDENSILVLNPESRELVWRTLKTEDTPFDETLNFHWSDEGDHQKFTEESTLLRTNVVRRSTRPRKVVQRYNS